MPRTRLARVRTIEMMTHISSLRLEKNHPDFFGVITTLPRRPVNEGRITRSRAMSVTSKAYWLILTKRIPWTCHRLHKNINDEVWLGAERSIRLQGWTISLEPLGWQVKQYGLLALGHAARRDAACLHWIADYVGW